MAAPERAYVALGSNLGDRAAHLRRRARRWPRCPAPTLVGASAVEETAPLGGMAQPPYLNQMVLLDTALEPRALLGAARRSSAAGAGCAPSAGAPGPSTSTSSGTAIARIAEPDLIIPHPELPNRDFWLRELAELEAHER